MALADFNEAIRLDPGCVIAWNNRGLARFRKSEYDQAIADCGEAIRLDPKFALAYLNRGGAWSAKAEYDKAIADCAQAIRLDPKLAYAYNSLAWLWATCPDEKCRDGKKAVESAMKACELGDWKIANHLDTLAAAYAEAGEFDAAMKWQTKAIELYGTEKEKEDGRSRLKIYQDKTPYRDIPKAETSAK